MQQFHQMARTNPADMGDIFAECFEHGACLLQMLRLSPYKQIERASACMHRQTGHRRIEKMPARRRNFFRNAFAGLGQRGRTINYQSSRGDMFGNAFGPRDNLFHLRRTGDA